MIDVANGTNVDVRLGTLVDGVVAASIVHAGDVLALQGSAKGVRGVEALARSAHERRN